MKIEKILIVFIILEIFDIVLGAIGISSKGLSFEKNLFIRNLIENYGFFAISFAKIILALAIAFGMYFLNKRYKKFRKFLFYFSILLCLIAGYGVFSSIYALYP